MKNFMIVTAASLAGLELRVDNLIREGWRPTGSISNQLNGYGIAMYILPTDARTEMEILFDTRMDKVIELLEERNANINS